MKYNFTLNFALFIDKNIVCPGKKNLKKKEDNN
jgi:hypothetical protein